MSYTQEQLSKMSDLDIEIAAARMLGVEYHLSPSDSRNKTDQWLFATDGDTTNLPNYCSDWSLTGPLMVENSMRLERIGHIWYAERFVSCSGARYIASNENPLRAICEVILMMGES